MGQILAKSNGITLKSHSLLVSKIAVEIAKQSILQQDDDLIEAIRLGGLLHDIGKCQLSFQKKLKKVKKSEDEDNMEEKLPYRHNEVGWAFLSRRLKLKKRLLDIVLDTVYWHHGISNKMGKYNDTDIKISDADIIVMSEYLSCVVDNSQITLKPYKPKQAPGYFIRDESEKLNEYRIFARVCVISADRLASSFGTKTLTDVQITELVSNSNIRQKNIDYSNHIFKDNDRFLLQKQIVVDTDRTSVIKAPAGFGKTLVGLLWSFNRDKKLIWVCPRNIVAESVYKSVIEELEHFGINNVSVELYLTGERKLSINSDDKEFSSDIIITNIDNYLKPSVDNRNADRLHLIINSDVIFDEYHELVSEMGLYSCFINIMRVRHQLTNSNTLLLSATPTNMHILWDRKNITTKILPNINQHYPAPHNKKYKINILDSFSVNPEHKNNLIIFNAIANSQNIKNIKNKDILIHSNFMDEDKHEKMNLIYKLYGKNTKRGIDKPNIIGTPIIQASLDISLTNLYESVLSPEATLQRIGRCDRWGDYDIQSTINIFNESNKSEVSTIRTIYNRNLSNSWFEYMSQFNRKEMSLNELYSIYNNFNIKNKSTLEHYLIDKHVESLGQLSNIHPIKFFNKTKTGIARCDSNKLRSSNADTFVICKNYKKSTYTNPFTITIYDSYRETFDEPNNALTPILKAMKMIRNSNDDRFDYNDLINDKRLDIDKVRKFGKKANTPYIIFNKVYHPDYGIIQEDNLINLLK